MAQRFEFNAAHIVKASFELDAGILIYRQGVARTNIELARVRAFAVRERPTFLGTSSSQLLFRLDDGRLRRAIFDTRAQSCRDALAAIRAAIPGADATQLPWPGAAARLEITAHPWYEGFQHPRTIFGIVMLGATAAASSAFPPVTDSSERLGQGVASLLFALAAVYLIVSGFRRTRAKRE